MGTHLMLPIAEAAAMVGRTRPAILKAIQKGKLTATRDAHGRWLIDPRRVNPRLSRYCNREQ